MAPEDQLAPKQPQAIAAEHGLTLVVLPFYNQADLAVKAVLSLMDSGWPLADILVVDDGSAAPELTHLQECVPGLQVHSQKNSGFGAAANWGARNSVERGYAFTLILNTDAIISNESVRALESYLSQGQHARVGACAPIIYEFGDVAFAGAYVDTRYWGTVHVRSLDELAVPAASNAHRRPYLTGCVLMCRNSALRAVNFFAEDFFMYWEDVDLSLRLVEAGWDLAIVPNVEVTHLNGGSSGGEGNVFCNYYEGRNRFLMWRRHGGGWSKGIGALWPVLNPFFSTLLVRSPRQVTPARLSAARAVMHGLFGVNSKQRLVSTRGVNPLVAFLMWVLGLPLRAIFKTLGFLARSRKTS